MSMLDDQTDITAAVYEIAAAAFLQTVVKPYHQRADYGGRISSQINLCVFLCSR